MARPQKETAEHRAAFDLYLSMGADRNLLEVSRRLSKSETSIKGWSKAFKWQERIVDKEKAISDRISEKVVDDLAEAKSRHLKISRAVQGLFAKRLNDAVDPTTGKLKSRGYKPSGQDAARWADLERDILGAASGSGGAPGDIPEGFEGVEVEQIERFLVERVTRFRRIRAKADGGD